MLWALPLIGAGLGAAMGGAKGGTGRDVLKGALLGGAAGGTAGIGAGLLGAGAASGGAGAGAGILGTEGAVAGAAPGMMINGAEYLPNIPVASGGASAGGLSSLFGGMSEGTKRGLWAALGNSAPEIIKGALGREQQRYPAPNAPRVGGRPMMQIPDIYARRAGGFTSRL